MRALPLVLALLCGCASAPDFVTASGLAVYDPGHNTSAEEVQSWIDLIVTNAPEDPSRARTIEQALDGADLTINPTMSPADCGVNVPDGYALDGCEGDHSMLVDGNSCGSAWPAAGVFAHEVGHLLGYHHDFAPWFAADRMERLIDRLACDSL